MRLIASLAVLAAATLFPSAAAAQATAQDGGLWTPILKEDGATVALERRAPALQPDGTLETRVMVVFERPQLAANGRAWHYMLGRYRVDCPARRTAVMQGQFVTATGEVMDDEVRHEPIWRDVQPGTPNAALIPFLCDGVPMPAGPVWDVDAFLAATRSPDALPPVPPPANLPPPVAVPVEPRH